jgi:L-threonylcarbamoyladenylate synthase
MSVIGSAAIAVDVLTNGGIVAFPTETVYGLGGNAYDDTVVSKIFQCKGRPEIKPLSVCYSSLEMASVDVEFDDRAVILAKKFFPGPLTIVLKRKLSSRLSRLCSAGLETVGVRVPMHPIALDLLSQLPFPLAAPSANKSGASDPITAQQVSESLKDMENLLILDGGTCSVGTASTIVDLFNNRIVRVGALDVAKIRNVIGKIY